MGIWPTRNASNNGGRGALMLEHAGALDAGAWPGRPMALRGEGAVLERGRRLAEDGPPRLAPAARYRGNGGIAPLGGLAEVRLADCGLGEGTRVRTSLGDVPVQQLLAGDLVALPDGHLTPVLATGRMVLPAGRPAVRIQAGALADGLPRRDLVVPGEHGLALDGVRVAARELVDGVMIRFEYPGRAARFYEILLAEPAAVLAEGVAAGFGRAEAELAASVKGLAALRERLCERLRRRGYCLVEQRRMALQIGGRIIAPAETADGSLAYAVPPGARHGILAAPDFVPAEVDPNSLDRRRLGVAVRGVTLNGAAVTLDSVFSAEDLQAGGPAEGGFWTCGGDAVLNFPAGTRMIGLDIAAWPKAWHARPTAA